jgi:hypothetical protein
MENNDDKPAPTAAKNDLLEELESIKGLLDDSFDDDLDLSFDIPILDDVVAESDSLSDGEGALLDLQDIFNDAELEEDLGKSDDQSAEPAPAELALDNLKLADYELEDLELDDDSSNIDIPDFDLETVINNSDIQPTNTPSSSENGNLNEEVQATEAVDSLSESIGQPDEENIWLEDDPVADQLSPSPSITETAFKEEEQHLLFDDSELQKNANEQPEVDLDFLIQELVDEFIPQIEDQLRRRLSSCSASVIKGLADKHLD